MKNISLVFLILGLIICPSLSIKCYREVEGGNSEDCPTTVDAVDKFHNGLSAIWKWTKGAVDTVGSVVGNKKGGIVKSWGEAIKEKTGIDLSKAGGVRNWTKNALENVGADFDMSNNCYVRFEKSTKKVTERACGALGAAGDHAAQLVSWFQGNEYGGNCFKVPGHGEEEVCFCNKDNCNGDPRSAKKAMGIDPDAKVIQCENMEGNKEECPLKDMRMQNIEFNNACYLLTENEEPTSKGCFTKAGLYEYAKMPNAEALTSAKRKISDGTKTLEIFNVEGGHNSGLQLHVNSVFVVAIVVVAYFI